MTAPARPNVFTTDAPTVEQFNGLNAALEAQFFSNALAADAANQVVGTVPTLVTAQVTPALVPLQNAIANALNAQATDPKFVSRTTDMPVTPTNTDLTTYPGNIVGSHLNSSGAIQPTLWNRTNAVWADVGQPGATLADTNAAAALATQVGVGTLTLGTPAALSAWDRKGALYAFADAFRWAWQASGTPNGGTVIAALNGGVWSRELLGAPIEAAMFGFSPLASAVANTVALNAAMSAANARGGGEVHIGPGQYELTNPGIRLYPNVTVRGCGRNTILHTYEDVQVFYNVPSGSVGDFGIVISDMDIRRDTPQANTATYEITITDGINFKAENVEVYSTDSITRTGLSGIACLATGTRTAFMSQIVRCWMRSGSILMQTTDSRIEGCYVWGLLRQFAIKNDTATLSINNTDYIASPDKGGIWCTTNSSEMQMDDDCRCDGSYDGVQSGIGVNIEGGQSHNVGGHFYLAFGSAINAFQTTGLLIRPGTYRNGGRINDPNQTTGVPHLNYGVPDIVLDGCTDCVVHVGTHIITTARTINGPVVQEINGSDRNVIVDGSYRGNYSQFFIRTGASTVLESLMSPNGRVDMQSGTATIPANATFITVPHILGVIPRRVTVTPTSGLGAAKSFWRSTTDQYNVGIRVDAAPGQAVTFDWQVFA